MGGVGVGGGRSQRTGGPSPCTHAPPHPLTPRSPPDWLTDGPDLLALIRTAYGAAHSFHDSNLITFKRVAAYRRLLGGCPAP